MSNTIEEQLASMRSSLRRQRLFNLALVGIAVAAATVAATRPTGDATFDTVTCKKWTLVDQDGKLRIAAGTHADGSAGMTWLHKDGKKRISAGTSANGDADMMWTDQDGKLRIAAGTHVDGSAGMTWLDKDEKPRIGAGTLADGTVNLPITDLKPKP